MERYKQSTNTIDAIFTFFPLNSYLLAIFGMDSISGFGPKSSKFA